MSLRRRPAGIVRIQSGRWKGRTLPVPPGARPTSGRARASLFDLLGGRLAGARVLDLYAGSGAVGLEAVSRGASSAVLVEPDAGALAEVPARWGAGVEEVRILAETADRAIRRLVSEERRFDVVFADPPYGRGALESVERDLRGLAEILAPDAAVIVQADADSPAPAIRGLAPIASRAYGRNVFHFLGVFDGASRKC